MVEFCGHIIFHNAISTISCPIQRASNSCADIGSSVILNKNCVVKYNNEAIKFIQLFKFLTKKFKYLPIPIYYCIYLLYNNTLSL